MITELPNYQLRLSAKFVNKMENFINASLAPITLNIEGNKESFL